MVARSFSYCTRRGSEFERGRNITGKMSFAWKGEEMAASVDRDEAGRYGGDDAVDFREGMKVTMVCSEDGGETELKWW